jgi:hypothetical protein
MKTKFIERRGSVWARVAKSRGATEDVWVSFAFEVVSVARTKQGDDWGVGITFYDPDGKLGYALIRLAELACNPRHLIRELTKKGLMVSPALRGRDLFAEFLYLATRGKVNRILVCSEPYREVPPRGASECR